jgi:hypothetical protein
MTPIKRRCNRSFEIWPKPQELAWERDRLGNHVAIAHFADRSDELRFVSTILVQHAPIQHAPNGFHKADIKGYACVYPFNYSAKDWSRLRRFILPLPSQPELQAKSSIYISKTGESDGTRRPNAACHYSPCSAFTRINSVSISRGKSCGTS